MDEVDPKECLSDKLVLLDEVIDMSNAVNDDSVDSNHDKTLDDKLKRLDASLMINEGLKSTNENEAEKENTGQKHNSVRVEVSEIERTVSKEIIAEPPPKGRPIIDDEGSIEKEGGPTSIAGDIADTEKISKLEPRQAEPAPSHLVNVLRAFQESMKQEEESSNSDDEDGSSDIEDIGSAATLSDDSSDIESTDESDEEDSKISESEDSVKERQVETDSKGHEKQNQKTSKSTA